ncbi:hypothetical protein [[Eubacterium] cellulosolvens]
MQKTIVSTKDLVKIYDTGEVKVKALNGISLELQQGEMVAVMGPRAAGKLHCSIAYQD